jgi:formylglycine-generating enzyme required for sulfatase activity
VPIPAGTFIMGSPDDEKDRDPDEPAHEVTLSTYYIAATPVTVRDFSAFVVATRYLTEAQQTGEGVGWNNESGTWEHGFYTWSMPGWKQRLEDPVVCLSWEDAQVFCRWLCELEDNRERVYRLPTEAEWEYACRAGTTTPFFFGADLLREQANYDTRYPYTDGRRGARGVGRTTPVGSYPANAFGLFDLHGNAWEWCHDWYAYGSYQEGSTHDPQGVEEGMGRVLRGGSWCNPARDCRSALRRCGHAYSSRYQDGNTGFRLALSRPAEGP